MQATEALFVEVVVVVVFCLVCLHSFGFRARFCLVEINLPSSFANRRYCGGITNSEHHQLIARAIKRAIKAPH
jgi:hypothetical protein